MSGRVPLLAELCAGTAAVSLVLEGGRHARPPVSRMGSKRGYAAAILECVGLRPGQGADRYLWCDPDPGCRAMLRAYGDRATLTEAARIIRGWADEDPRALWERLRAEGPIRDHPRHRPSMQGDGSREVARATILDKWSFSERGHRFGYGGPGSAGGAWGQESRDRAIGCAATATVLDRLPDIDRPMVAPDATAVDPREVARWGLLAGAAYIQGDSASGYVGEPGANGGRCGDVRARVAGRLDHLPAIDRPVVAPDATAVDPGELPEGTIAYIDPPYQGTSGYADDLPRADVVALARRWADAGAWVVVSEAEPLDDLEGWDTVEITRCRIGQKRTFSRQQLEWLTMSRPPMWRPNEQLGLPLC